MIVFQGIFHLWSNQNCLLFTWSFSNMISFTNGTFRFLANERCYFGRNQFTLLQSVIVTYTNIVHASKCSISTDWDFFSFIEMYIVCTLLLFRVYNSITLVMYSKYFSWTISFRSCCVWRIFLFSLFIFLQDLFYKMLREYRLYGSAWCYSNVNFAIFVGIFRSWSNEKQW